jgi:hypothetical protein
MSELRARRAPPALTARGPVTVAARLGPGTPGWGCQRHPKADPLAEPKCHTGVIFHVPSTGARSQQAGCRGKAPRHRRLAAGRLCGGWICPAVQAMPAARLTGSAVIVPVPRAASGLCGRPGAFAVRPARHAAMPWPAQRAAAPGAAAGPGPACRGAVRWRTGWQHMGACARDSPPFVPLRGGRTRPAATPVEWEPASWPRRPGRRSVLMITVRYRSPGRSQRRRG